MAYKPVSLDDFRSRLAAGRYATLTAAKVAITRTSWSDGEQEGAQTMAEDHFANAPSMSAPQEPSVLAKLGAANQALKYLRKAAAVPGAPAELKSDLVAVAKSVRKAVELLFPEASEVHEPPVAVVPPPPTQPATPPRLQVVREKIVSSPMSDPSMEPREDLADLLDRVRRGEVPMTDKERDELLTFGQIVLEGEQKKKEEAAKGRKP